MSDLTLDQVLNGEEIADEPETETEEQADAEPTQEESGEEAKTEEPKGEATSPPPGPKADELADEEEESWTKKAVLDERRKRQELERELEKFRTQQEPKKAPDVLEDPEGFGQHYEQRIADIEFKSRVSMSQSLMRRQHEDYDAKEAQFLELAQSDPSLVAQLRKHEFPAEFVYQTVQKHERFSKFDSFDSALAAEVSKKQAELEKSITERLTKEYEGKLKKANSIPPSGADGSLTRDTAAVSDESLDEILGNK